MDQTSDILKVLIKWDKQDQRLALTEIIIFNLKMKILITIKMIKFQHLNSIKKI